MSEVKPRKLPKLVENAWRELKAWQAKKQHEMDVKQLRKGKSEFERTIPLTPYELWEMKEEKEGRDPSPESRDRRNRREMRERMMKKRHFGSI